jgi:hypothetical protein
MRDRWAAQIAARDEMIGSTREIPGAEAWPFRATLFGPLRVRPGTHRAGVLTDEEVLRLASGIDLAERLVAQGGVVIMRPLVIHASSKATSEPRRVLQIEYASRRLRKAGVDGRLETKSRFLAALGMTCLIMVRECRVLRGGSPGESLARNVGAEAPTP